MATLEIIALDESTPQLRAPASGDSYKANRAIAITPEANGNALAVTGFSLTGANAHSLADLTGTWNTTGTPAGIKLNVTDTASNAASLLLDLQIGGTSKFGVAKTGVLNLGATNSFVTPQANGVSFGGSNIRAFIGGTNSAGAHGVNAGANAAIGFSPTSSPTSFDADVQLARDAADALALRRGTHPQAFRIYNTYASGNADEWGFARFNAGVFELGTAAAGSGASRDLALIPGGGGSIRMGTHTALGSEAVTGYITIKDAGGTARKLAVVS
jgi:hypothetical protein